MGVFGSGNNLDASGCVIDDGHLAKETHHGDGEGKIRVKEASPRLWSQVLCAVIAAMGLFAMGCSFSFPGVTLPELTKDNSTDLYLDPANAALFGSILHIGCMIGSFIACVMLVRLGQRTALLICLPVNLVSWIVLATSSAVLTLHGARLVQGISYGVSNPAAYTLVTEVAFSRYRGRLCSIVDMFRSIGVFFVLSAGALMSWRSLAIFSGVLSTVLPFFGLLFLPNSPRWLASKRRYQEAEDALQFYRGPAFDITPEMSDIRTVVRRNKKDSLKTQLGHLREWQSLKRLLVLSFLSFGFQFTGYSIAFTFTVSIFMETKSGIDPYMSGVLLGVTCVVGAVFYLLTADCCGRKLIFMFHSLICSLALTCISVYFYVKFEIQDEELASEMSILPLVSLLTISFSLSSAISNMLQHQRELMPLSFRAAGINILGLLFYGATVLVIQGFPLMVDTLHLYGSFACFAGITFLFAFYPMALMPETRKKSLEEIEMAISKPKASLGE
ncbi:facilitated trehalose transporter Tret1-like [Oratosquilla oratoria]|uniref:facilitated trehalose transporter Tret1-like n=1 Tax=Oratosquilla oratoria TaxID=337810 RepID=UPI003F767C20